MAAGEDLPPGTDSPREQDLLPSDVVAGLRERFPITKTRVFLNHAGVSPTSVDVVSAVHRWMIELARQGRPTFDHWESGADHCRGLFAKFIGADADEVTFVRNTSHGLSLFAAGFDWCPGDRVAVATSVEYPSNVYPWEDLERRGVVSVDTIPVRDGGVRPEDVVATLRPETRVLAVSSAQYASGAVTDLAALGRICRDEDVILCVDAIQTVGALPIDVKEAGIHVLSADSHKWMLGMMGIGGLFIDRSLLGSVRPALVGWRSMVDGRDFDHARFELLAHAGRFEEGSLSYPLIAGFAAALELLQDVSVQAIAGHTRALIERLASGLAALGCTVGPPPPHRHHILAFSHPYVSSEALGDRLETAGIVVSVRRGMVRVSPHLYNTPVDMDAVLETVRRALA